MQKRNKHWSITFLLIYFFLSIFGDVDDVDSGIERSTSRGESECIILTSDESDDDDVGVSEILERESTTSGVRYFIEMSNGVTGWATEQKIPPELLKKYQNNNEKQQSEPKAGTSKVQNNANFDNDGDDGDDSVTKAQVIFYSVKITKCSFIEILC